jgi:hypothetical protein
MSCLQGICPTNNVLRMDSTNLFLNAGAGYSVIPTWDNGNTAGQLAFRVGNGAAADAFDVWTNAQFGLQNSSTLWLNSSRLYDTGASLHLVSNSGTVYSDHYVQASGDIWDNNVALGSIGLTGDLPGFANGTYPTVKSNYLYLYFAVGGFYSAYMNSAGVLTAVSDRNRKEHFVAVDA